MVENGKVMPRRPRNAERRPREYLTPAEVKALLAAARQRGRHGHRDATLILVAYRHGLRLAELVALRWDLLDLAQGTLHVVRRKNGRPSVHILRGDETRALRRLQREQTPSSAFVFTTERQGPFTASAVRKLIAAVGRRGRIRRIPA
jgi:type 1 fimbriae regulatory protein FimB/type 1 fimbriae regulatory protein FimE